MSLPVQYEMVPGYCPPLASFLARRVFSAPGQRMDWEDVYLAFAGRGWRWPPSRRKFAEAMAYICDARGVAVIQDGRRLYCPDMQLGWISQLAGRATASTSAAPAPASAAAPPAPAGCTDKR